MNIVTGGAATGDAIVRHHDVKRIAFTGSVRTGLAIQRACAESGDVKHLSLELGGKNAMVVFPDVDLEAAVEGAVFGMNLSVCQGQSCGSNSRILVHSQIHDGFVEALAARLRRVPGHDGLHRGGRDGTARVRRPTSTGWRATSTRGNARAPGSSPAAGGPTGVPDGGYFLRPAAFDGVEQSMGIAREEIFGPIVSVLRWDRYDDMIEAANAVELGLTASVWTNDLTLAHRTADLLDAGYVWVNDSTVHYVGTPFGGVKNSGTGREESEEELLELPRAEGRPHQALGAHEALAAPRLVDTPATWGPSRVPLPGVTGSVGGVMAYGLDDKVAIVTGPGGFASRLRLGACGSRGDRGPGRPCRLRRGDPEGGPVRRARRHADPNRRHLRGVGPRDGKQRRRALRRRRRAREQRLDVPGPSASAARSPRGHAARTLAPGPRNEPHHRAGRDPSGDPAHARASGGGSVVNQSSPAMWDNSPGRIHYAVSKGAILPLTRSLARELAPEHIRVNADCTGVHDDRRSGRTTG